MATDERTRLPATGASAARSPPSSDASAKLRLASPLLPHPLNPLQRTGAAEPAPLDDPATPQLGVPQIAPVRVHAQRSAGPGRSHLAKCVVLLLGSALRDAGNRQVQHLGPEQGERPQCSFQRGGAGTVAPLVLHQGLDGVADRNAAEPGHVGRHALGEAQRLLLCPGHRCRLLTGGGLELAAPAPGLWIWPQDAYAGRDGGGGCGSVRDMRDLGGQGHLGLGRDACPHGVQLG